MSRSDNLPIIQRELDNLIVPAHAEPLLDLRNTSFQILRHKITSQASKKMNVLVGSDDVLNRPVDVGPSFCSVGLSLVLFLRGADRRNCPLYVMPDAKFPLDPF
ncbi:MAG: hypothetical protein U9Q07_14320 [Planctomycetota bacterium]|nr:hypothetical protein [Planctomycetota bacterium]